jgi:hypothetical protein
MQRLMQSRHLDTFYNAVAGILGILVAVCTVVGLAVLLGVVDRAVR